MFTGLVEEIGRITRNLPARNGRSLRLRSRKLLPKIQKGDSVAINGVCQTVVKIDGDEFEVQITPTTLAKTTLGTLKQGEAINLELAMRPQDRFGGHWVQGHVTSKALVINMQNSRGHILTLKTGPKLFSYLAKDGPVALDGISLTIADCRSIKNEFEVAIIPHTWAHTTLKNKRVGDEMNIEVDIVAKYVEALLFSRKKGPEITESFLKARGFS